MVDNEKQWDNIEYTEDNEEENSYMYNSEDADENSTSYGSYEDEEDSSNGYEDEEYEEDDDGSESSGGSNKSIVPVIVIIIILLLLGGAAAFIIPKMLKEKSNADGTQPQPPMEQVSNDMFMGNNDAGNFFNDDNNSDQLSSVNFNDNGDTTVAVGNNPSDNGMVAVVSDAPAENISGEDFFGPEENTKNDKRADSEAKENNSIMVVYNRAARLNPFKPPIEEKHDDTYEMINNTPFEIIEPPHTSIPDANLTKLLQTQISGILYDEVSPSAIINLNGMDQFVKIGDVVYGYKIENITRSKVQISYKNNSYVASVGELFSKGALERQSAVSNLENKFAGRNK